MRLKGPVVIIYALVFIFVMLIYLPTLRYGFINFDDPSFVSNNPDLKALGWDFIKWAFTTTKVSNYWHPLTWVSYSMDYTVWGVDPMGYRLTNILIHGVSTLLVMAVFSRVLLLAAPGSSGAARLFAVSFAGIFFGLHPLRVESVVWISERKDVLFALFYLASIVFYLKYVASEDAKKKRILYALCLCSFLLSVMSKSMAISLPLTLLIIDYFPLRRKFDRKTLYEKMPFFVLSAVIAAVTLAGSQKSFAAEASFFNSILIFSRSLFFYIIKMLYPANLRPIYPVGEETLFTDPEYSASLLMFGITTAGAIYFRKKAPYFAAVWAFYVVSLLPVMGTSQAGVRLAAADRFTYIPLLGPQLLLGALAARVWDRPMLSNKTRAVLPVFLMLLIASGLAFSTVKQYKIWSNDRTFWNYAREGFPGSYLPPMFRGMAYMRAGLCEDTLKEMEKDIDFLRNNKDYAKLHNKLGSDDLDKALFLVEEKKPEAGAIESVVGYLKEAGKIPEAVLLLERAECNFRIALAVDPGLVDAHHNIGTVYVAMGKEDDSIKHYQEALRLDSKLIKSRYNLAVIFLEKGLKEKARKELEVILKYDPGDTEAANMLKETHR